MINPGSLAGQIPAGDDALIRRVQDLERIVRELQAQDVLKTAGIIAAPNQITVQGNETVSGTLSVTGNETVSGALNVTGPMTVGGTLSLPAGIINNDALANPVIPAYGYANANTYPIPAGQANRVTRASISFTVPTGCTKALISAVSQDTGTNSGTGFDYLQSYVLIGTGGAYAYCPSPTTPAGYSTTSLATMTSLMTGLTGGQTITVYSQPYTYTASWASTSGNGTIVSATCLFLR